MLAVGVNAQNTLALTRKSRAEIDGGLRLANAAFPVCDCDDFC
jgi:hypothetical protein